MTEKEALQNAADEARKAARAGREFAGLLDEYAKYLTQPSWHQRAEESYRSALNKLNVINDGLAACQKLFKEGVASAAANSALQNELNQIALQQAAESEATRKHTTQEKPIRRQIRIAKKAVGK